MHTVIIGSLAFFLYLIAAILLGLRLNRRLTAPSVKWQAIGVAFAAASIHGWLALELIFIPAGLNLSMFNALSLITWIISLLLIFSALSQPTENIGIVLFPSAALSLALEITIPGSLVISTEGSPIGIHILISMVAYSLLSIAAVQALLLATQNKHLRNRQPGGFIRALPPLQTMETLLFQIIAIGFVLQSLSLLSGFMFIDNIFAQHLVHKTVLSIIAWALFGILLWGRWRFGWRGRTAIRWTLSGFIALAFSYIGSKFVLELVLSR